jgi:hypothetical protein
MRANNAALASARLFQIRRGDEDDGKYLAADFIVKKAAAVLNRSNCFRQIESRTFLRD